MKKTCFRLLLILFALASALGAAELAMRLLVTDESPLASSLPYFDRSRFRFQAEAGRRHPFATNDASALRIAVIGDSITFGAGVLPYDRYGNRLEALLNLNEGVTPALVETFATPGSSTFQQTRLLGEALEHQPRIVILGICANDLEDWTKPEVFKAWRNEALPHPPPEAIQWSRVLRWCHSKLQAIRADRAHIDYYRKLYDESYSGRYRFELALDQFRDACLGADASLLAVVFPMLSWDLREEHYPFGFVRQAQLSMLEAHHIPTLDLWPLFEGKESIRLEVIPGMDGHPNEIAHRLAAEAIYLHLLEQGLINGAYRGRHPESQFDYWEALHRVMQGQSPTDPGSQ